MRSFRYTKILPLAFVFLLPLAGCSGGANLPELGQVSGTVTLDGQPLDGATIEFVPEKGRPSSAITDESGNYKLRFSATTNGAVLGKHDVAIRSFRDPVSAEGDQPGVEGRDELLPARYHENSELTAEVAAGSNTIDFTLTSEGAKKCTAGTRWTRSVTPLAIVDRE